MRDADAAGSSSGPPKPSYRIFQLLRYYRQAFADWQNADEMDDGPLRHLIREKLHEGRLPQGAAVYIAVAPSAGEICTGCDQPIGSVAWKIATRDSATVRAFDEECFHLWDVERLRHA
jgi:hypothetical protein